MTSLRSWRTDLKGEQRVDEPCSEAHADMCSAKNNVRAYRLRLNLIVARAGVRMHDVTSTACCVSKATCETLITSNARLSGDRQEPTTNPETTRTQRSSVQYSHGALVNACWEWHQSEPHVGLSTDSKCQVNAKCLNVTWLPAGKRSARCGRLCLSRTMAESECLAYQPA